MVYRFDRENFSLTYDQSCFVLFVLLFRRRTVILAIAAISVLVVSGVIIGLAFGLEKRKIKHLSSIEGISMI